MESEKHRITELGNGKGFSAKSGPLGCHHQINVVQQTLRQLQGSLSAHPQAPAFWEEDAIVARTIFQEPLWLCLDMMHFELAQNNLEMMVSPSLPRSPGRGWRAATGIREGRKMGVRWIFTPPILLGAPPDPAHIHQQLSSESSLFAGS